MPTSYKKGPCVVLQSQHRESLAVATKRSCVETISIEIENEVDGGGKNDVNKTTLDLSLKS